MGFDPFKGWGRKFRHLALRRFGFDFDDAAAYSNASLFFIVVNHSICKQYLDHKDLILKRIGRYYFPSELEEVQHERAKQLIHRLDMEGSLEGSGTQCIFNTIFSGPKSSRIFRGKEFLG
jgi:hypothetical protein